MMPSDRLLFLDEAAARLRTPERTLQYWRAHGQGPRSAKLGRRIVYLESDLEKWLAAQFTPVGGDAA